MQLHPPPQQPSNGVKREGVWASGRRTAAARTLMYELAQPTPRLRKNMPCNYANTQTSSLQSEGTRAPHQGAWKRGEAREGLTFSLCRSHLRRLPVTPRRNCRQQADGIAVKTRCATTTAAPRPSSNDGRRPSGGPTLPS